MRTAPTSISIAACSSLGPPQPVIATGTKPAGRPLSPCSPVPWRRQRNNRLGLMSCRRATADTLAPGAKLSATIAAFASADQRRRRPVPLPRERGHRALSGLPGGPARPGGGRAAQRGPGPGRRPGALRRGQGRDSPHNRHRLPSATEPACGHVNQLCLPDEHWAVWRWPVHRAGYFRCR